MDGNEKVVVKTSNTGVATNPTHAIDAARPGRHQVGIKSASGRHQVGIAYAIVRRRLRDGPAVAGRRDRARWPALLFSCAGHHLHRNGGLSFKAAKAVPARQIVWHRKEAGEDRPPSVAPHSAQIPPNL
jgi:hypothetical protein